MKMYFSTDNNKKIVSLPYVPDDSVDATMPQRELSEVGGHTVLGDLSKAELSLSIDYPADYKRKKGYLAPNSFAVFFQNCIKNKKMVRVVCLKKDNNTFFNRLCVVKSVEKSIPKKNGDIPLSIKFKER